jgi:hypothetical protein
MQLDSQAIATYISDGRVEAARETKRFRLGMIIRKSRHVLRRVAGR